MFSAEIETVEKDSQSRNLPRVQRIAAILWPSFILSGIATIMFFAYFDPVAMLACEGKPLLSRLGGYSIGFFLFWLLTTASGLLTMYFLRPCPPVNPPKEQTH